MTTEEIIEVIKGLTVLELNDLVKACEEEFGVSAAAGVVVAAAGAEGGAAEEKTEFDVELTAAVTGLMLINVCGETPSRSCVVILSRTTLSILERPILYWF